MSVTWLVDFYDSFTYNIYAELKALGLRPQVIACEHFRWPPAEQKTLLVLGPGPGSPEDYPNIYQALPQCWSQNIFVLGVCLGHQLLWRSRGVLTLKSARPCHGRTELVRIPPWKIFSTKHHHLQLPVQRYNSLSLAPLNPTALAEQKAQFWWHEGEVMGSFGPGFLTYQFHPESVGTSYPKLFFEPCAKIFYND